MLGRFSVVLQNAVDALAPPAPLYEDFIYHWKKLMKHYLDVTNSKQVPIELTNIPAHLDQLLKILIQEEEAEGTECRSYLVEHSLVELVVTLGLSDDPPGMRQHVLQFVTTMLTKLRPHPSLHLPLQRLVTSCNGKTPSPTERDEVNFLFRLMALLRCQPSLIPSFTIVPPPEEEELRRASVSSEASSGSVNALLSVTPEDCRSVVVVAVDSEEAPPLPVVDALLSYIDTPDCAVRLKVCQALMLFSSLGEARLDSGQDGRLARRLVERLACLYNQVPPSTPPHHLDDMSVSWGLDVPTSPCLTCDGCRQMALFVSWFDFCDQVMKECRERLAILLQDEIQKLFLEETMTLSSPLAIAFVAKCVKASSSPHLSQALCSWIAQGKWKGGGGKTVCDTLLENWAKGSTQIAIETLRLFELLVGKAEVMESLIFCYLQDRGYVNEETHENGVEEEDDSNHVDKIMQRFLSVVPFELSSSTDQMEGYDQYVQESRKLYQASLAMWTKTRKETEGDVKVASSDELFFEGPFLRTLLDSVSNIPNQEYELNLELTAVVSQLALHPEPRLSEFLLDTTLPLKPYVRSLVGCLEGVAKELGRRLGSRHDCKRAAAETRARLLGDPCTRVMSEIGALECVVILEELCKELAAISLVKEVR